MPLQRKLWYQAGDCNPLSYGGTWTRHIEGTRYHVVRLDNMDEACGSDNEGQARYAADLSEVDIASASLDSAIRSCDAEDMDDISPMAMCEMLHSYGAVAPLWSGSSNNAHDLIRSGKRESRMLEADTEAYEARMGATPVNRLGQTAREYASGTPGLVSAIQRGEANGDRTASIVAKMYRACDGQTLGGEVVRV